MEVIATKAGYFGDARRHEGERFDVPAGTKASWFVPVDKATTSRPKRADKTPDTLTDITKADADAMKVKGDDLV